MANYKYVRDIANTSHKIDVSLYCTKSIVKIYVDQTNKNIDASSVMFYEFFSTIFII